MIDEQRRDFGSFILGGNVYDIIIMNILVYINDNKIKLNIKL